MNRCHQQIHFHLLVHPLTHSFTIKNTFYVSCGSHLSTCVCVMKSLYKHPASEDEAELSEVAEGRVRSVLLLLLLLSCRAPETTAITSSCGWTHLRFSVLLVCKCFTYERLHCSPKPSCPVRHKRPKLTMLSVFLRQL